MCAVSLPPLQAAVKFICEAAQRRVSGSSSPPEVAAPVVLTVARIANVMPPDVHRASMDAICLITVSRGKVRDARSRGRQGLLREPLRS